MRSDRRCAVAMHAGQLRMRRARGGHATLELHDDDHVPCYGQHMHAVTTLAWAHSALDRPGRGRRARETLQTLLPPAE